MSIDYAIVSRFNAASRERKRLEERNPSCGSMIPRRRSLANSANTPSSKTPIFGISVAFFEQPIDGCRLNGEDSVRDTLEAMPMGPDRDERPSGSG